jgi:hypothetical protein
MYGVIFYTLDNMDVFLVEIFYQSVYKSMDFVNYLCMTLVFQIRVLHCTL